MRFRRKYVVTICVLGAAMFSVLLSDCWGKKKESPNKSENITQSSSEKENKLVRLESLEDSFLNCLRKRQTLAITGLNLQNQLKDIKKKKGKKDLKEQLEKVQQELGGLNLAMNVIFNPLQPFQYEYNPVKSEVFLKIGNLEQIFIKSIQLKEAIVEGIGEQEKSLADKKNKSKKEEIEKGIENLKQQYQIMVASLQIVFNVVPERNYMYNPKDSTLYLKVTEKEASRIQEKFEELKRDKNKDSKKKKP